MVSHDRLFKMLLTTFFSEFIDLFVPQVARYIDRKSLVFLDKELFTGLKKHEADIIVKARFKGKESFFLIHTEVQSQRQANFSKRLFGYFAALHEKFELPIYPIALLSFKTPVARQGSSYVVRFPDRVVLRFNHAVIQLNRLRWRRYLNQPNPTAAALMAKMNIAPKDRARVKLECLRMLATLRLDSARNRMISGFIGTYLDLTAGEEKQYMKMRSKLEKIEEDAVMEIETSWSRQGRQEGLKQGRKEGRKEGREQGLQKGRQEGMSILVIRLLNRRLGEIDQTLLVRVQALSPAQLEELSESQFMFKSITDLEQWLNAHETHAID